MRAIFANSAYVKAPERFVLRQGRFKPVRLQVRFGLVLHPDHGPVLIDCGYGPRVTQGARRSWALGLYARILSPELIPEHSVPSVLARFGYEPEDVKLAIVTHFHADHVACLRDLPNARFITDQSAWANARAAGHLRNVRHGIFKELFPDDFSERIIDLHQRDRVQPSTLAEPGFDLLGDQSLIAIPLPGHAPGHFGVLFATLPKLVFYAVDAQWVLAALGQNLSPGFPATLAISDQDAAQKSTALVNDMRAAGIDIVLCHDPTPSAHDLTPSNQAVRDV